MKAHNINYKKLKLLALTGLMLVRNDVSVVAKEVKPLTISFRQEGNPEYSERLHRVLANLDDSILDYAENNNLEVVILEGEESAEEKYQQLYGYVPGHILSFTSDNTIYIEGSRHEGYYEKYPNSSSGLTEDDFYFRMNRDSLLQELGVFIDTSLNNSISNSEEFLSIYREEQQSFTRTIEYNVDNLGIYNNIEIPCSYLAASLSCYVAYPDSLSDNCPKTYEFINRTLKNLNKNLIEETSTNTDTVSLNDQVEIVGNPVYGERIKKLLNLLASGLKRYIKSRGLRIIILDGEKAVENVFINFQGYSPGRVMGVRFPYEVGNAIYIEGCKHSGYYEKYPNSSNGLSEEEFNFRIVRDTLLHELGHFLDEQDGYKLSSTQEFINIYYNEVNSFTNTKGYKIDNLGIQTNKSNSEEYFATSFSCFISYSNDLKMKCPRTYSYFYKMMMNLEYQYSTQNPSLGG